HRGPAPGHAGPGGVPLRAGRGDAPADRDLQRRAHEAGPRQPRAAALGRGDASDRVARRLMRVIDMECSVPKRADGDAPAATSGAADAERPAGYGMANYERIFRSRQGGGDARPTDRAAYVGELAAYVDLL